MKTFVLAVSIALVGCAATPSSEDDQTIEQFVSNLSGKELHLYFPVPSASSTGTSPLSGARDPMFGYAGLKQVYAPAYKHCEAGGGILLIVDQRSFSKVGPNLPARFQCRASDKALCEFGAHYTEKALPAEKSGRAILLIPQASVWTAADIADRRANRDAMPKPEQRPQEKEKTKQRKEPAEKAAGEPIQKTARGEELKLFRNKLKAGDRVQWKTGTMPVKGVGQVVRLDGDLALVQFDNQTLAGQSVRYFNRLQLEPFDGVMPVRATP